jgi:5-methylcytosine-specific restriction endonuclease McrA
MLFNAYRASARHRGHTFLLTLDEFGKLIKQECFYCGVEPKQLARTTGDSVCYNGLDRIDNNKGYELSNIVTCCGACNRSKYTSTQDEYLTRCRLIAFKHPKNEDSAN